MPKGIQKSLPRLTIVGSLALLAFNYPILSLYRGDLVSVPMLYIGLFGIWLFVICVAGLIAESKVRSVHLSERDKQ